MSHKAIRRIFSVCVVGLILALPFGFLYVLNNGNPFSKFLANKYVPNHLQELGYSTADFKEAHYVEPLQVINTDFYHGHYMVIFKDEPDTTYYYGVTKWGNQVKQFCEKNKLLTDGVTDMVKTTTKHSEKQCVNSLDNR
ncbi:MAG TPA: DUF3139 domain-containing protein [Candidatus Angelobacter sp.]|nr:DUF3139 domain-containing protein [Candidatus Angelobacter sp.]